MFACDRFTFVDEQHYFFDQSNSLVGSTKELLRPRSEISFYVLHVDRRVDCSSSNYRIFVGLSILVSILLVLALVLITVTYRAFMRRSRMECKKLFFFLARMYREKYWYWDLVICVRKMLGCFVIFLPMDATVQLTLLTVYIGLFFTLHAFVMPHRFAENNLLDGLSYATALLLCCLFAYDSAYPGAANGPVADGIMGITSAAIVAVALVHVRRLLSLSEAKYITFDGHLMSMQERKETMQAETIPITASRSQHDDSTGEERFIASRVDLEYDDWEVWD